MTKLGVGIGDEFPIDDGNGQGAGGREADPEYEAKREEWRKQRDAYRQQRAAFREQRRKWRDFLRAQWRERRRAMHEEMYARGESGDDDCGYAYRHWRHGDWRSHRHMNIVAIVGVVAILAIVFSHLYVLFGLVVLAGLYLAYRGSFDHFDFDFLHAGGPASSPPAPPASGEAPKG